MQKERVQRNRMKIFEHKKHLKLNMIQSEEDELCKEKRNDYVFVMHPYHLVP